MTSIRPNKLRVACQSNLKSIALSLKQYQQDSTGLFPLALGNNIPGSDGYGWAGSAQKHLRSVQILQCPSENTPAAFNTFSTGFSDYWFNGNLSGLRAAKLKYPSNTLLAGDGNSSTAAYSVTAPDNPLAPTWANRHLNGANYAFADGHVKWLKPTVPSNGPARSGVSTFRT